jgi:N-acetylglucosaminyl-diphospho-decaprenol L-rhamnosyltransferase
MNKKVSIVIITKDTKELLRGLLDSIKNDQSLQPFIGKIIIIDNASADATGEMIGEEFPVVVYVRNERNMGFAFSANRGSSLAEDEYILFLNSDTILIQGELEKMVRFMDGNTDIGICGPQLVYPDMKPQRSSAAVPSLTRELFPLVKFKVQSSKFKVHNIKEQDSQHLDVSQPSSSPNPRVSPSSIHDSPFTIHDSSEVPSLIGAAVLVRREILKSIGGFDERFFFFLEETDLCVRIWQAGYRVVLFPEARIIHLQGRTVRRSWINGRIEYNISLHKFIKKLHSPAYYRFFLAIRLTKALFLSFCFPLAFFGERIRMKYAYYVRLVSWYLRGCPDNAGLKSL